MRALRVAGDLEVRGLERSTRRPFAYAFTVSSLRVASLMSLGTIVTLRGILEYDCRVQIPGITHPYPIPGMYRYTSL